MLPRHETDLTPFRDAYSEFVGEAIHPGGVTMGIIENQVYEFIIDSMEKAEPGGVL